MNTLTQNCTHSLEPPFTISRSIFSDRLVPQKIFLVTIEHLHVILRVKLSKTCLEPQEILGQSSLFPNRHVLLGIQTTLHSML